MTDEIKKAEKRGYGRGYNAGLKRKLMEVSAEAYRRKKDAFWQRAFLAALPSAILAQNWNRGGVKIVDLQSRVLLAKQVADEALMHAWPISEEHQMTNVDPIFQKILDDFTAGTELLVEQAQADQPEQQGGEN